MKKFLAAMLSASMVMAFISCAVAPKDTYVGDGIMEVFEPYNGDGIEEIYPSTPAEQANIEKWKQENEVR